jgi:hypothetical protein
MHSLHFISFKRVGWIAFCVLLLAGTAWAQDSGTVNQAFAVARQSISPDIQTHVVSAYGIGTPTAIQKWYFIFYDPSVPSHGRAVLVENNQITKTYPANGGTTYASKLAFDPARINSEGPALSAAQGYAAKHNLTYDSITALLKQTSVDRPFRWRIGLVNNQVVVGYLYVNAVDDTIAAYVPANASHKSGSSSEDGVPGFANDVKNTFLGVGGDLQQFFTGERTVDK